MKSFIKNVVFFSGILIILILVGVSLPTTPRASTSHMYGKLKMDSLLKNLKSPRLILLGGSNLSLSINSQMLKDSLDINPINTAISWNIGFVYMFENTLKFVKPGDIIVASLEYEQFYDNAIYGGSDLVRIIFDVAPDEFFHLRGQQYYNMLAEIPYYALTKFKPNEYFSRRDPLEIYDMNATNQYGDNCKHWSLPYRKIPSEPPLPIKHDTHAFDVLKEFETLVKKKGATLLITFPALQESSFKIQQTGIKAIEKEFLERRFWVMGYPERYIMPDTLIFDTPYHLIKKGVDLRTNLLIEDLKLALNIPGFEGRPNEHGKL